MARDVSRASDRAITPHHPRKCDHTHNLVRNMKTSSLMDGSWGGCVLTGHQIAISCGCDGTQCVTTSPCTRMTGSRGSYIGLTNYSNPSPPPTHTPHTMVHI